MTVPEPSFKDGIDITDLIRSLRIFVVKIKDERKMILGSAGVATVIGLLIAFGSGAEYTARKRILPYRNGSSAGGLSGLAGLAGIRIPAGASDQTITADLYPEVAKTQDFKVLVAETPLTFVSIGKRATVVEYFRNLYTPSLMEGMYGYTIGLPGRLISLARPVSGAENPQMPAADSTQALVAFDRNYLDLVNTLDKRLSVTIDKKTAVITITGLMPDPYAAADLVRATSDRLMERIIDYESRKASEQFRFVEEQYQRASARYERAQRALAVFADRNRALMSATAQIDRERLQREHDLAFELYQQFSRELEQARIKMNQDTPVFTVLEQVTVPPDRTSPRRGQILLLSIALGLFAGIGRLGVRQLLLHSRP